MAEHEPAVRRLCLATAAGAPGLLTRMQRSAGFYRLYLRIDDEAGTELAFAAPGLDGIPLVTDLIAVLRREATLAPGHGCPHVVSFHAGPIKVVGDGLGGAGADQALALVRHPAVRAAAGAAVAPARLAVAVTARLFARLRTEGLDGTDWRPVPPAGAWLQVS